MCRVRPTRWSVTRSCAQGEGGIEGVQGAGPSHPGGVIGVKTRSCYSHLWEVIGADAFVAVSAADARPPFRRGSGRRPAPLCLKQSSPKHPQGLGLVPLSQAGWRERERNKGRGAFNKYPLALHLRIRCEYAMQGMKGNERERAYGIIRV